MNSVSGIGYNGYNVVASRRVNEDPQEPVKSTSVNFKANDYPYYNVEQKKQVSPFWYIAGALAIAAGTVFGMGYTHKTKAISKLSDGWVKDTLTKCEPAFEKCYDCCKWIKHTGIDGWDKVKGWFNNSK